MADERPLLVRDRLFIGNISHAAKILQEGDKEITHVLSVLSSSSISFFTKWKADISIPTKEIRKVYGGGEDRLSLDDGAAVGKEEKVLYLLEFAGPELKLVRMAVPLRDTENENLLDYLNVCLDFIDESRKEGAILVHCFAGVSRSAAIITAYLMKTEQLSQEDALKSLQLSCDNVCPNDGFLEQLKMFEDMGFKVSPTSSIYKRFHLKQLGDCCSCGIYLSYSYSKVSCTWHCLKYQAFIFKGESFNRGDKIDFSKFGADPGLPTEGVPSVLDENGVKLSTTYNCKKCHRAIALHDNVVTHTPGESETSFEWKKWKKGNLFNRSDELECSFIYVEPLKWMTSVEDGASEGKLSCAGCEARLGNFNWLGIQCSCGSWISPAFQLHKSRVDRSIL